MGFHHLVNTQYFKEAAEDFRKNGGYYTRAPRGSREYEQYWDMWEERCRAGMLLGDLWVPGRHIFYLNFTPITKLPDEKLALAIAESRDKHGKIGKFTMEKIFSFPRFYEVDYEWYNFKNIAWHGGDFMGVHSDGAQHIVCAKTRGAGFSFKEASDGVYNYTFIPKSKSYYFASIEQYLTTDGILNKAKDMMDFINDNCPEWKQNRLKSDQLMRMKASFVDENGAERGNMSEIIGVVVDNPNKTRGKRGRKIVFEEAGSFKKLTTALKVCIGSIQDGGVTTGQISVFGTGGEEGPSIQGLEDIFNDPRAFNMLAFKNVFEEGMQSTEIGYFVPAYRTNPLFMDTDGNVDMKGAYNYELDQREIERTKKNPKELDGYCAEYPLYPAEVFQRVTVNPFYVRQLNKQLQFVKRSAVVQAMLRYGHFMRTQNGGVEFTHMSKREARPIENYPHDSTDNLEGCWTIAEEPYRDAKGQIPKDMYRVVFDPFYKEETTDISSLFCIQILKMYNNLSSNLEGLPVAWWRGRPEDLDTAYDALFCGADYYGTDVNGEISGGGQGVIDYARTHHLLHLVRFEPEFLNNKEINKGTGRKYLMNMGTERKRMGLTYLVDWHKKLRSVGEKGEKHLTLHRYYDVVGLQEMIKFNGIRNADTISALIVGMFELKEQVYMAEKEMEEDKKRDQDRFFNRELFSDVEQEMGETTTSY